MNYPVREDARPLKEFYPDPRMRHAVHKEFAHRFLPGLAHHDPQFGADVFRRLAAGVPYDPVQYIHFAWGCFEEMAGLVAREPNPEKNGLVFRRPTDLSMSIHGLDSLPAFLVRMPQPERTPEAYFVAIVFLTHGVHARDWPKDRQARVFTLEESEFDPLDGVSRGFLCEWSREGQHRNYQDVVKAEPGAFLKAVMGILQDPGQAPRSSFTPGRDVAGSPTETQGGGPSPRPPSA